MNSNYRLFEESIISAKTKHIHTKTFRFNKTIHKQNSWMTDDLLKQTNFKNKLYKQFKQTPPNNYVTGYDHNISLQSGSIFHVYRYFNGYLHYQ